MFFADGEQPGRIGTASWFTAPTGTFETSDGFINIAIVNQRPRTLTLKQMIECFIDHRREVIRRR